MSEQASFSKDIVGGLLASPISFMRTCVKVLMRPTRFYEPIAFGDRTALRRAFSFFVVAAGGSIATHFFLLKIAGLSLEMPPEMAGGGLFNQIMQNDWLYKGAISAFAISLCMIWYWILRRKAVRDRITSVKFIHAVLYPAGALLAANVVLGAIMVAAVALAPVTPVATAAGAIADPAAREMIGMFCKDPNSYMCRYLLVQQHYPLLTTSFLVMGYVVWFWFGYIVASVLKSKTGISKRRTILALVLALFSVCVLLGAIIGFYIAIQHAGA